MAHDTEPSAAEAVIARARAVDAAVRALVHAAASSLATMAPADVDQVLAHLADAAAALPQVTDRLAQTLDRAGDHYDLAMDGMTHETDPSAAIAAASRRLRAVRGPASDIYQQVNGARRATAHIGEPHVPTSATRVETSTLDVLETAT